MNIVKHFKNKNIYLTFHTPRTSKSSHTGFIVICPAGQSCLNTEGIRFGNAYLDEIELNENKVVSYYPALVGLSDRCCIEK